MEHHVLLGSLVICIPVFQLLEVTLHSQLGENSEKRKEGCMHGVSCRACVYLFIWACIF